MTTLREQLQAARLDRIKRRIAEAWDARSRCQCPICTLARTVRASNVKLVRLSALDEGAPEERAPSDAPKH